MEYYSSEKTLIKKRKISPQNIIKKLMKREMYGCMKPGTHFHVTREFYQSIFPNFTISNVMVPLCFIRKFSPDGLRFIAFSFDQASIEVYQYKGAQAAAHLLRGFPGEYAGNRNDRRVEEVRQKIFYSLFDLKYVVNVAPGAQQQLNRECSLFTDDGRYVIVGAASYISEELRPNFFETYTNNECVIPNPKSPPEDYTLFLVDIHHGRLCDTRSFFVDKIFLSHNQGLYLYKNVLAVLSVQHQTIHVFQLIEGMFIAVRTIGRFCYEDDDFFVTAPYLFETRLPRSPYRAVRETTINALKHRMLVFLFKRAVNLSKTNGPYELRAFYRHFDQFKALRMWKMQLLDEQHLLIKYAGEEVVTLKSIEPNAQPSFFVVYNIFKAEILAIYENTSEELLHLFENFCDHFRNAKLFSESQFTCSPSNNVYARLNQQRFKQTIISAKYGGPREATKRLLAQLPISAQSYSSSPYLDLSLFSYDDKWVSIMERPKGCGEHPIRFYDRNSGLLKFRISAGVEGKSAPPLAKRLVAFTFHPTDPFAISVQRTNADYVINFHIRHEET